MQELEYYVCILFHHLTIYSNYDLETFAIAVAVAILHFYRNV